MWFHVPLSSQDVVVKNSEGFVLPVHFLLKHQGLPCPFLQRDSGPQVGLHHILLPLLFPLVGGLWPCTIAAYLGQGRRRRPLHRPSGDASTLPRGPVVLLQGREVVPGQLTHLLPPVGLKRYRRYEVILTAYNIIGESPASAPVEVFVGEAGKLGAPLPSGRPGMVPSGAGSMPMLRSLILPPVPPGGSGFSPEKDGSAEGWADLVAGETRAVLLSDSGIDFTSRALLVLPSMCSAGRLLPPRESGCVGTLASARTFVLSVPQFLVGPQLRLGTRRSDPPVTARSPVWENHMDHCLYPC